MREPEVAMKWQCWVGSSEDVVFRQPLRVEHAGYSDRKTIVDGMGASFLGDGGLGRVVFHKVIQTFGMATKR